MTRHDFSFPPRPSAAAFPLPRLSPDHHPLGGHDAYGHVNNVVYYQWFDTAVNAHLIEHGVLDIHQGDTIGLVVETHCHYFSSLAFPQNVDAGIRVAHLGNSSVRYEVGLFAQGADLTAAHGHFVHVYVNRESRRPVSALPTPLTTVLERLT